ncbi:MAG TPA: transketolase [Actinomycetota bacterium]|nr:transketolase [Actinomycetota bacterium]
MTVARTTAPLDAGTIQSLCVNTLRTLAMDAVEKAQAGHPGAPMGAAPMAFILWTKFLKHDPSDPRWIDRDRFILSAGHASMLLYSLLHLTDYDLPLDELKAFRQWGSRTPGHPEYGIVPGVETTTGPLGQGFGNGVGMAMAERHLAERFNRPEFDMIDHYTYCICSDGDLMEGVTSEAASLAGHLRLGKLVYLYDSNGISIDGATDLAFTEDVPGRFAAYGWHVSSVADGNDLDALEAAVSDARSDERPSLIEVRTHIGYGSPGKQDTAQAHGAPLGSDEVRATKDALGWTWDEAFFIPAEVKEFFRTSTLPGAHAHQGWCEMLEDFRGVYPDEAAELDRFLAGELPSGWDAGLPSFTTSDGAIATRKASGQALNALVSTVPELIGGSADLTESNNTALEGTESFRPGRSGRYIHFGVREHAMGAALNGMALHGLRPFGGTFLIFSDYMKPSVRLAALMGVPSIFVFTHDSIGLGEDGPTHQPVEQLAGLRAIPNLVVFRPADANETVEAWRVAVSRREGPVALCLSRQSLPVIEETSKRRPPVERGAYVLKDRHRGALEVVLIATGSEVHLALAAAGLLAEDRVLARVVSMPSWELFEEQPASYRDVVLPPAVPRVAIEAGSSFGWSRWTGSLGEVVALDRFGDSAPGDVVMEKLGFTPEHIVSRALEALERSKDGAER